MSSREPRSVVSVAPGVVFVEGPVSNWVVLAEEDGVALVDAGYPADDELAARAAQTRARRTGAEPGAGSVGG